MVQALMAGKIDATLPNVSEATNQVADGTFRALVVLAEKRLKDYPDVPSSYELGIKAKCSTTRGYAVLASTPKPILLLISTSGYQLPYSFSKAAEIVKFSYREIGNRPHDHTPMQNRLSKH